MAKIFISYSRVDEGITKELVALLREQYGYETVWYDEELHRRGGADWWEHILDAIAASDIFVYLLSNESITSVYCQAEFTEAQRLQKRIVTIQVRDRTKLPPELSKRQYVDLKQGLNDVRTYNNLLASINHQIEKIPSRKPRPLKKGRTPKPFTDVPEADTINHTDIQTPDLHILPVPKTNRTWNLPVIIGTIIAVLSLLVAILQWLYPREPQLTPSLTTEVAAVASSVTDTPSLTTAPSNTPQPTLDATQLEQTVQGQMQVIQTEARGTIAAQETATSGFATAFAQQTRYRDETAIAHVTQTAESWTNTPTPDTRKTAEARLTIEAVTMTQVWIDSWTATPTNTYTPTRTYTPSNTPTNTYTPSNTPTRTYTPSNTPDMPATQTKSAMRTSTRRAAIEAINNIYSTATAYAPTQSAQATLNALLALAQTDVIRNADWTPIERDFDGVTMVLVPEGCFQMGSDSEARYWNGSNYVTGVPQGGEQCFESPFWIDKYEVWQKQFRDLGGIQDANSYFTGDDLPMEQITWFEADTFCREQRGGRLPSESEWEYAARGVDELVYPWGNDFAADNVVYANNSNSRTANVESRPNGISWIGALDLSGNVLEWTNSLYNDYPYDAEDGREADTGERTGVRRVLRGGSWLNSSNYLRVATRSWLNPSGRDYNLGFRCVRFN